MHRFGHELKSWRLRSTRWAWRNKGRLASSGQSATQGVQETAPATVLAINPCDTAVAHALQVINALRFNPHLLHWEDLLKKFATINLQVLGCTRPRQGRDCQPLQSSAESTGRGHHTARKCVPLCAVRCLPSPDL